MPVPGKDLLADSYSWNIEGLDDETMFQEFNEDALVKNNIFIKALPMDFRKTKTPEERKAINQVWIDRLPELTHVKQLDLRVRVTQEFFDAVCRMKNLQALNIWTGVVEDISSIEKLANLKFLGISNFSRLENIEPVTRLRSLESLSILASFKVSNYDTIGSMHWLKSLELGGDSFAPKNLMLESLAPFSKMSSLVDLEMSSASIRDKNYRPLLELNALRRLDAHWRMKKAEREFIQSNHPKLRSGFFMAWDFTKGEFKDGIEWWID